MNALKKANRDGEKIARHILTTFKVSCHFCGLAHEEDLGHYIESEAEFITARYKDGWREITSRNYNVVSIACPECVSKNDKDR